MQIPKRADSFIMSCSVLSLHSHTYTEILKKKKHTGIAMLTLVLTEKERKEIVTPKNADSRIIECYCLIYSHSYMVPYYIQRYKTYKSTYVALVGEGTPSNNLSGINRRTKIEGIASFYSCVLHSLQQYRGLMNEKVRNPTFVSLGLLNISIQLHDEKRQKHIHSAEIYKAGTTPQSVGVASL